MSADYGPCPLCGNNDRDPIGDADEVVGLQCTACRDHEPVDTVRAALQREVDTVRAALQREVETARAALQREWERR